MIALKMSKLLCPNVLRFCPNFQEIKIIGGELAPPAATPLLVPLVLRVSYTLFVLSL